MISLKDKVCLVTGGSRGIGRAICLVMAQAGCNVIINYREKMDQAQKTLGDIEKFGVKGMAVKADIANYIDVKNMIEKVIDNFGRIDILVNNAGIWKYNPIDKMTVENLKNTLDINLTGIFYTAMAVTPIMKQQKSGTIINISSTAGQRGEAFYSPYGATKGAVISLTKSLASLR